MKTTKLSLKKIAFNSIFVMLFFIEIPFVHSCPAWINTNSNTLKNDLMFTYDQLILQDTLALKIRVYLEGALMNNENASAPDGRPLMRDNLRVSPFDSKRYIPLQDPYQYPVFNSPGLVYDLSATPALIDRYKEVGCGLYPEFRAISDSTIFNTTGQDAIVDWIFVELRDKDDNTKVVATRAGLLQRDGDIVDLDGASPLSFPDVEASLYFIALKHRNHLSVMSKSSIASNVYSKLVDFTSPKFSTFDKGLFDIYDYKGLAQKEWVKYGYESMWAGDFNSDGNLKSSGALDDLNILVNDVLALSERETYGLSYDKGIGYLPSDYNMNSKSKYDNPHDDKNMLYGQVLFYPLNSLLMANFNGIIEQLP